MEETRATRERLVQVSAVLHWSTPLKTLYPNLNGFLLERSLLNTRIELCCVAAGAGGGVLAGAHAAQATRHQPRDGLGAGG